jgi:hypothetical protein
VVLGTFFISRRYSSLITFLFSLVLRSKWIIIHRHNLFTPNGCTDERSWTHLPTSSTKCPPVCIFWVHSTWKVLQVTVVFQHNFSSEEHNFKWFLITNVSDNQEKNVLSKRQNVQM